VSAARQDYIFCNMRLQPHPSDPCHPA
jgi:hypothetical protein